MQMQTLKRSVNVLLNQPIKRIELVQRIEVLRIEEVQEIIDPHLDQGELKDRQWLKKQNQQKLIFKSKLEKL